MADYYRVTLYFTEEERKRLFRAHKYGKHGFLAKTPGEFCKFTVNERTGAWVRRKREAVAASTSVGLRTKTLPK